MTNTAKRARRWFQIIALQCVIALVTLAAIELILRAVDLGYLRRTTWGSINYDVDPELGWFPRANSTLTAPKMVQRHNSQGFRDIEFIPSSRPTVLFVGDSFVWGHGVGDGDRFTDFLRDEMIGLSIVNVGITGYGTDQQYLLLRRIWDRLRPDIVVLVFCVDNDRHDNSSNIRYDSYKPYVVFTPSGELQFRGQPVPKPRRHYYEDNWAVRNLLIARVVTSFYVEFRHPRITNPDPTERLVGMIHDFVEARGAKFLVGLQRQEAQLAAFLQTRGIPHLSFAGAEISKVTNHWSPDGHRFVAGRIKTFFADNGIPTR